MEPATKKSKSALSGLTICIGGTLTVTRKVFEALLESHGATNSGSCGSGVDFLVCSGAEVTSQTTKVRQAQKNGIPCVSENFIRESIDHGAAVDPSSDPVYVLSTSAVGSAPAAFTPVPAGSAASRKCAKAVMLAKTWEDTDDPTNWWISEKLDGVRAYWDGADFYSREGNPFPAPDWFKQGLPACPLDGELWCGRQKFRQALSIIKNTGSGKQWEFLTYMVFDAPNRPTEAS